MTKVLVVDDESPIREVICFALHTADYLTLEAGNADEARKHIIAGNPDLILLDLMLPGRSGLELAHELKRNPKTRELPIIMLTARAEENDKVKGLDAGADDYITKPFSPLELLARVKAVLRRSLPSTPDAPIDVAGLYLEPVSHRVTASGMALELAPTEYRLLHFFMSHPERAYSRPQLLNAAWGRDKYVDERTVDVHIRRLRKILEPTGHHELIQTVRGLGYRFSETI